MKSADIVVPHLGDFKDVLVAEILVGPGDIVSLEQPIALVESEKATVDIPSPLAGKIVSVEVAVGDRVSEGSLLAKIEFESAETPADPVPAPTPSSPDKSDAGGHFDLIVIGGGPGGYSAAFRAADLGLNVAIVERGETLGGVCLNVGCIPSKALLHVVAIKEEAERLASHGVTFGVPRLDLDMLRQFKAATVRRLTDGLAQMAAMRAVHRVAGSASFSGPHGLVVSMADGAVNKITFNTCIIAAGSSPFTLPFLPTDPRIVDSTGALELPFIPQRMLVIGGGIIGMEMATVYSALGTRIDVVEQMDQVLGGVDRDLVAIWTKRNKHRFDNLMVSTKLESVVADADGLVARFDNSHPEGCYDMILQSAGRRPNGARLSLDAAGLETESGFIAVDAQMRTQVAHIFAVGDIVGQPMLAHKAIHQGHVAAETAAGHKAAFDAMVIPSVAYVDPEIAWVGLTEGAAKESGTEIDVARFPWSASGRAIANGADYGLTKLVFSRESGRIVGGAIVGPNAGDLIGEVCLAIELGADALDIGRTIHPHPTLGETIGMAAEVATNTCTDLPAKGPVSRAK